MEQEKYRISEDGTMLVKKVASNRIGVMPFVFGTREVWFPCLEANPDRVYIKMMLGGWCGLHKFEEKRWICGFYYLFTCGGFGVFYLFDLMQMFLGNYSVNEICYVETQGEIERQKRKFYYRPLTDKRKAIMLFIAAIFLVVLVTRLIYQPIYTFCMKLFADALMRLVYENDTTAILPLLP